MNTFLTKLLSGSSFTGWGAHIFMFVPRFVTGMLLTIDFGSSKFGMPWTDPEKNLGLLEVAAWFPEDVAAFGAPFSWAPWFFAWMGAASEAIGGLFLALGFQTRLSAFLIGCTMLTAIFFQKWGQGTWGMLPAMGFLWVSMYSLVHGSGKLGLDYWVARYVKKRRALRTGVATAVVALLLLPLSSCGSYSTIGVEAKEAFVLGEGAFGGFSVKLTNLTNQEVPIKAVNRKTGIQTQGFGLGPWSTAVLNVAANEKVLIENPNEVDIQVRARLSRRVNGMRYQALSEE